MAAAFCWLAAGVAAISLEKLAAQDGSGGDLMPAADLVELALQVDPAAAASTLATIKERLLRAGQDRQQFGALQERLAPQLRRLMAMPDHPAHPQAVLLMGIWRDSQARILLGRWMRDAAQPDELRAEAAGVLLRTENAPPIGEVLQLLRDTATSQQLGERLVQELAAVKDEALAQELIRDYEKLPVALRPRVIELLTQRPAWAAVLLLAIQQQKMPKEVLHAQQLIRLQSSTDPAVVKLVREIYGTIRTERQPEREQVIREVRQLLASRPGDPFRGREVFRRLCAQCHRIYGEGQDVGPDLTRNGRGSFQQLLSNVLDPNLVVGEAYQSHVVVTADGRLLTGLLVENTPEYLTLKLQGGKLERVLHSEIEQHQVSPLSLMPEGLEKQLSSQELADLFAFLRLDRPPEDPQATLLPDE
ncbi:MAG: hypothetical protein KatS3mg110_0678 [Pirellulaceae bacterium]|nr:MAG: hypothetical protein KatS3mg110_0678 [Pirellulaceae bacterium]